MALSRKRIKIDWPSWFSEDVAKQVGWNYLKNIGFKTYLPFDIAKIIEKTPKIVHVTTASNTCTEL